MSKKNKRSAPEKESYKTSDYYKLNTKAVNDLVEADESNSPQVSEKELRKFRSGFKYKIPDLVKIVFVKWWFAACVCFFFPWGLGLYIPNTLDMLFVTGLALGGVTDLLTNNVIRYFEPTKGAWAKWLMFYKRRFITLPLNILYSYVLLFFVYNVYRYVNEIMVRLWQMPEGSIAVGVEPILFGLLIMGFDMLMLVIRNTTRNIVTDARKANR